MKRLFSALAQLTAVFLLPIVIGLSGHAAAINVLTACDDPAFKGAHTDVCGSVKDPGSPGENPIIKALKVTITILSIIIGFVAVLMIIVSGLNFITANGDAQAAARARGTLINALIGLAIAAMAQSIVLFVLNKL